MRIGITGATGTLGHALIQEVTIRQKQPVEIQAYRRMHNDIDLDASRRVMTNTDVFVHFAAWTAHKIPENKAAEVIKTNVLWTAVLVRLALESRTARFIFASSRMVYNLAKAAPEGVTEDAELDLSQYQGWLTNVLPQIYTYAGEFIRRAEGESPQEFCSYLLARNPIPNGARDLYALSKYMGEKIVSLFWLSGREGICLRFAPVFGPSPVDRPDRAVPMLINMINSGREVTVMPWETAFLYLGDLAPAMAQALDAPVERKESVIHLGPHLRRYSQEAVARMLLKISGKELPVRAINAPPRRDELLDVSRARRILCLKETPIETALRETLKFFLGGNDKKS